MILREMDLRSQSGPKTNPSNRSQRRRWVYQARRPGGLQSVFCLRHREGAVWSRRWQQMLPQTRARRRRGAAPMWLPPPWCRCWMRQRRGEADGQKSRCRQQFAGPAKMEALQRFWWIAWLRHGGLHHRHCRCHRQMTSRRRESPIRPIGETVAQCSCRGLGDRPTALVLCCNCKKK